MNDRAYSRLELKYARPIANAILCNGDFREWLLSDTKHSSYGVDGKPVGEIQASYRSKGLKNPYWFNYWCPKDKKCECRIGSGIETDILLVLSRTDGRRLGLHLEIKRPGDNLRLGQAESYGPRAACWINPVTRPKTVIPHDDFLTILVCGREPDSAGLRGFFDKVIFHDDLTDRVGNYPEE